MDEKSIQKEGTMTWVYLRSEPNLYTVGFYSPDGGWNTDYDYATKDEAAKRVHYLNGGKDE